MSIASTDQKRLVEIGVLAEVESAKEKLFLHPKLLTMLTTGSNTFEPYA